MNDASTAARPDAFIKCYHIVCTKAKAFPCTPTSVSASCCRERSQQQKGSGTCSEVQELFFLVRQKEADNYQFSKVEEAYPGWQTQSEGSSLPALTVVVPGGQLVHGSLVPPYE
jgi:hypothetical protein